MSESAVIAPSSFVASGLLWAHTIAGSIILSRYPEANGECNHVWEYNVLGVVYTGLWGLVLLVIMCLTVVLQALSGKKLAVGGNAGCLSAAGLALFIWGCIIYHNVTHDDACMNYYSTNAAPLWTLFQVTFWWTVAGSILGTIAICCACAILVKNGGRV
jgi:hypothetical protein